MQNTEKIIQLPLPFRGWREQPISVWRDRHHVSAVQRPTEDEALDNVYYAARAIRGQYGNKLNGLERKIYFYELRSFEIHPKWYTEADRVKWIAKKTGMPISGVKDVLYGVKIVLRQLVQIEDIAIEASYKQAAKHILYELSAEYEAQKYKISA